MSARRLLAVGLAAMMTMAAALPDLEAIRAERAKRSLRYFTERHWDIVEPDMPFVGNWHIDAIADHLEAVTRGEIMQLLINIPPGCMKSLLASVFWPAWEWAAQPGLRYLTASYSDALSIRDSVKVRDIVQSARYRAAYGVEFRDDQNQKIRMDTTAGGWRIATSVGGRATGEHPDRKIVDDPLTAAQAESEAARTQANNWVTRTMSTRGASRKARFVLIMQRLHQKDTTGHLLGIEPEAWTVLCLPMRYEPPAFVDVNGAKVLKARMETTVLGFQDPRTEPGELLYPGLFNEEATTKLEKTLGSYGTAGQLQQRPAPQGGGTFKREWFPIVDAAPASVVRRTRAWDAAGTENAGDWTAGVKMSRTADGVYYVEHVARGRWSSGVVDATMKQTADADGRAVRIREEQEPGSSGKSVIASHTKLLAGYDYEGIPATGAKETRWRPFAVQAEAGNVRLVRGPWNEAFLDELSIVPNGEHDDQADATAAAFNDLALGGGGGRTVEIEEG